MKGFYEYLQNGIRTWSVSVRVFLMRRALRWIGRKWKYNPATAAKYAGAIRRLKQSDLTTAAVAAEFGLHPDCFRQYLKEHEPELYARQGMVKTTNGRMMSGGSMAKYGEAVRLYGTTSGSLKSLARRFGVNECSLRDFIKRHFPEAVEGHRRAVERDRERSRRPGWKRQSRTPGSARPYGGYPSDRAPCGTEAETILRYNSKI